AKSPYVKAALGLRTLPDVHGIAMFLDWQRIAIISPRRLEKFMTRTATLLAVLLLGATWVVAQDTSSTAPRSGSTTSTSSSQTGSTSTTGSQTGSTGTSATSPAQTSITGCLSGTPASGNYTLTDSATGIVYVLVGNVNDLGSHIGQQVQITGQAMSSGNTSSGNTTSGNATSSS